MTSTMPAPVRKRAQEIAQHEFGHAVLSLITGFKVKEVSLQIQVVGVHRAKCRTTLDVRCSSLETVESYLRARIAILFAGAAAEAIDTATFQIDQEKAKAILRDGETGAATDYAVANELLQLLRNTLLEDDGVGTTSVTLESLSNELWRQTLSVVTMNARPICDFASELVSKITSPEEAAVLTIHEIQQLPSFLRISPPIEMTEQPI